MRSSMSAKIKGRPFMAAPHEKLNALIRERFNQEAAIHGRTFQEVSDHGQG